MSSILRWDLCARLAWLYLVIPGCPAVLLLFNNLHSTLKWELDKQKERKWAFFDWFKLEISSSIGQEGQ